MKNKTEFSLEFGGFYHSIHSSILDSNLEYILEENGNAVSEIEQFNEDNVDWKKTHENYAKNYLRSFCNLIDMKLEYIKLWSPDYYNFQTDKIVCEINDTNYNDLKHSYCNDNDFVKWLNDISRSRDGFQSFYSGIDEVKKEPSILMEYIFQYIIWHDGAEPYDSEELQNEIIENINCNGGAEIYFNKAKEKHFQTNGLDNDSL
tara:strand:- start:1936 stop:2547 length:612 start_codon:yes stop_codon:yes gene_type:complete